MDSICEGVVYILKTEEDVRNPRVLTMKLSDGIPTVRLLDTYEGGLAGDEFQTAADSLHKITTVLSD